MCVVIDDTEGVARAAQYGTDAVLDIGAIESARTLDRPVAGGEHGRLAAARVDGVPDGLGARALLDEQEIAAGIIRVRFAEEADELQGKCDVTV